jgi:Protein of unknown function (DUF1559)
MIRKWTLVMLLAVPLAAGFAGCGKKKTEDAGKDGSGKDKPSRAKLALPTAKKPIDTQYISDDFIAAAVLHPARALESKLGRDILAELNKELGKKTVEGGFATAKRELGVDPRKVEQVVVLIDDATAMELPGLIPRKSNGPKGPPQAIPSNKERAELDRRPDDEADGGCLPQEKKGLPGANDNFPPPRRKMMKMPPIPSVIVRFSEAVDQKAILSRLTAKFLGPSERDMPQTRSSKGPEFPGKKQTQKKPFPPTKSKPPKKSPPPKAASPKGKDESGCVADEGGASPEPPSKTHGGKTYHVIGPLAVCFVDGKTMLAGKEDLLKKMITAKDVKSPLTERLKTLGDEHDFVFALSVQSFAGMLEGLRFFVPKEAHPALDYAKKIKTLAITAGISGGTLVSVVAQMPSDDDAKGFATLIRDKFLPQLRSQYNKLKGMDVKDQSQTGKWFVKLADQAIEGITVGAVKSDVVVSMARPAELDNLPLQILPAIGEARQAAQRSSRKNDLKMIGLALFNYHDNYKSFPAVDSNGFRKGPERKSGLSWRVYLLPFLEQGPLFNEFKLDEPWDSPHNKKLIARMPALFANPEVGLDAKGGKTAIQVFVGKNNTPFSIQQDGVFVGGKMRDIVDGTAVTIAVVESGPDKAEIWTKPGGLPFDPAKNPFDAIGKIPNDGFLALFCDGHVQLVKKSIPANVLKLLIQHNDGQGALPTEPYMPPPGTLKTEKQQ